MSTIQIKGALILTFCLVLTVIKAEVFIVNSQSSFDDAQDEATAHDSILWESGTFSDIYMEIDKDKLYIAASILGETIFNGHSRVRVNGDSITFEGFQFIGGDINTSDVINSYGSYNHFNQLNIKDYTCYKYLRIREACRFNVVSYCNFENRLNLDDQNILSILVDENVPGYHKIQYCSFKNFDGTGNDLGIEPIRIGLSTQADHISRSLVEFCYFTQCNGDGELISSKATQNVYRYNTFEDNPKAELVLRHGSEAIVYGNFFLRGKGGVRVREEQQHYIYNNYFYDLDDRPIYLQNKDSDPLDDINIAFNTIIDCDDFILGDDGNDKPTNVTLSNNIFTEPKSALFEDATGNETWYGNIAFGSLGISAPSSGLTMINPLLQENSEGYFGLMPTSPAINAAEAGYALLPQFEGMEPIDTDISFDLMGQERPSSPDDKDVGCNEFPQNILIQPMATEENTGPSYDTDIVGAEVEQKFFVNDFISFAPNPILSEVILTINVDQSSFIQLDLFDINGAKISTILEENMPSGKNVISHDLSNLTAGHYTLRASSRDRVTNVESVQLLRLIKQ